MKTNLFDVKCQPKFFDMQNKWLIGAAIFGLTFLFAYLFEPFQINKAEHRFPYAFTCAFWGIDAFFAFYLIRFIRFYAIARIRMLRYDLIWIILLLLLIGVVNYLIRPLIYDNPSNSSFYYFLEELGHAFLFGILMLFFMSFLLARIPKAAVGKQPVSGLGGSVHIETAIKSESLSLDPESFIYAESEGNYLTVYFRSGDRVQKRLIRMTISDFEQCFSTQESVMRVHRSFIVNMRYIHRVNGNAKGYTLDLLCAERSIPVSRGNSSRFAERFGTYPDRSSH